MILPYTARLLVLSFGCFYLIHVAGSCAMNLLAARVLALAERRSSNSAARILLGARLFPTTVALLVVAGICVPSYCWLEPRTNSEEVGFLFLAAAFLGALDWIFAVRRGLSAVIFSKRSARHLERAGGTVALAGIIRPRLLISPDVIQSLSEPELAAALSHERAHAASHDNLKRLLILLAPCGVPRRILRGVSALETAWAKYTEWSADDCAAAGDPGRALSLATALVMVARMRAPLQTPPLVTLLVADAADLEIRINRLLSGPCPTDNPEGRPSRIRTAVACLSALLFVSMAPQILEVVHQFLEHLIR